MTTMRPRASSILDLALARLSQVRRLRWHYRSQHASLITFSNRTFYDRDLVVFPNAVTEDPVLGVKHTFVEGANYAAGINRKEAEAVLEAAVGLIYAHPDLSLGIATMNVDQRDLIFTEFERIADSDATVRAYVEHHEHTIEPFFVKNLENVQGDERDIILVSTLYGTPPGGGPVVQRFGPINSATGHRRLNVLFTRAKRSTMIFTSLHPSDIRVGEQSSAGLRAIWSMRRAAPPSTMPRAASRTATSRYSSPTSCAPPDTRSSRKSGSSGFVSISAFGMPAIRSASSPASSATAPSTIRH